MPPDPPPVHPSLAGHTGDRGASRLRIAVVAPPWLPTPPPAYGGTERVVALVAEGLARRGHRVRLVCGHGSEVPGVETVTPLDHLPEPIGEPAAERRYARLAAEAVQGCDVVFDNASLVVTERLLHAGAQAAHIVHGVPDPVEVRAFVDAGGHAARLRLIAISNAQARAAEGLPFVAVCHNGIDVSEAPFTPGDEGYLAVVGRMCAEKGIEEAILIARELGMPLRIAAKCREPLEREYFRTRVEPHLGDGVEFLGELDRAASYRLIAGARALLFPILWEEPFGMVLIEALATGTPVLALRRGAVPEVVRDGVTGFIRDTPAELVAAARSLGRIDPHACRADVVTRFSGAAMTRRYERVALGIAAAEVVRPRARRPSGVRPWTV